MNTRATDDMLRKIATVARDLKLGGGQFDEIVMGEYLFDMFMSADFITATLLKNVKTPRYMGAKIRKSPYLKGYRFTLMFHGDIVGGGSL